MSRSSSTTSAGGVCGREPHVTVLGAGIAGLALGYCARRRGIRATLYERERSPGGLSVTFAHDGFLFDSGAHRFHDKDDEVTREVRSLLGDDLRPVDCPSMIFETGRLARFPFAVSRAGADEPAGPPRSRASAPTAASSAPQPRRPTTTAATAAAMIGSTGATTDGD